MKTITLILSLITLTLIQIVITWAICSIYPHVTLEWFLIILATLLTFDISCSYMIISSLKNIEE